MKDEEEAQRMRRDATRDGQRAGGACERDARPDRPRGIYRATNVGRSACTSRRRESRRGETEGQNGDVFVRPRRGMLVLRRGLILRGPRTRIIKKLPSPFLSPRFARRYASPTRLSRPARGGCK